MLGGAGMRIGDFTFHCFLCRHLAYIAQLSDPVVSGNSIAAGSASPLPFLALSGSPRMQVPASRESVPVEREGACAIHAARPPIADPCKYGCTIGYTGSMRSRSYRRRLGQNLQCFRDRRFIAPYGVRRHCRAPAHPQRRGLSAILQLHRSGRRNFSLCQRGVRR